MRLPTPNFTVDEFHEVDLALHQHPAVLAVPATRGISDPALVLFDVWTYGEAVMPEQWRDRRLGWCDLWLRESPGGNPYAHPVSGLKVIVDLNTLEVVDIEDHHDYGRPAVDGEYDPRSREPRPGPERDPGTVNVPDLVPGAAIPALFDPAAPVYQHAPVIGHSVWVTAYDDAERWPAGAYPTQSGPNTGIGLEEHQRGINQWVLDDAALIQTDVVLWYVFGIRHLARPEDWPVMPADTISFWLKPFGFFDQGPALEVSGPAHH